MSLGNNSQMLSVLYIVGLFAILYFLMIRPQQQRQKKHQEMVRNIKTDDRVITIGGIYGTIVKIKDNSVVIKVADNVRIEFLKTAISQVISKEEEDPEKGS
ncbi:hypothetical protein Pmgp_03154 [Pelotomaculum propionicicum]|uniref:Sec translocon accessory complex subunit YajC n=2 Tax=Pelotomaculum propionicicum TaxID=258475 RepID=A0A4Y7RKD1_9FIRM|nr:preprotein translocase subunit YajC [Peptococcaceae bacterium]TEB09444.1 hypothetical protein Pmgp_03154 [Pelotomaculum propionicicum]